MRLFAWWPQGRGVSYYETTMLGFNSTHLLKDQKTISAIFLTYPFTKLINTLKDIQTMINSPNFPNQTNSSNSPSPILLTSFNQPETQLLIQAIDWKTLFPSLLKLVQLIQSGELFKDLQYTLSLIMEIIAALTKAEQITNLKIDWSNLISFFIKNVLPILIGLFGQPNQPNQLN